MSKKKRIEYLESAVDELQIQVIEQSAAIDTLVKQVEELQQWVRILKPPFGDDRGHGPLIPLPKPRRPFPKDSEVSYGTNTSPETGSGMPVIQATTADECGDVRNLSSPPIAAEAAL